MLGSNGAWNGAEKFPWYQGFVILEALHTTSQADMATAPRSFFIFTRPPSCWTTPVRHNSFAEPKTPYLAPGWTCCGVL